MQANVLGKTLFLAAKRFKASIALVLLLLFSYFLLSGGNLFIEKNLLVSLSFSAGTPLNLLSYMLSHMSLWHLALNIVTLLFFAVIVEIALGSFNVLAIFLFSGTMTVALFSLLNPGTGLIGASAGVCGIMASAFVLNFKKALVALAIAIVLFLLISQTVSLVVQQQEGSLVQKNKQLANQLSDAIKSGEKEKAAVIAEQKSQAEEEVRSFSESRVFASDVQIDPFLHSYAAAFGIVYLLLFRRKKIREAMRKQKMLRLAEK